MFINDSEVINYGVLMLIGYMISGPVIGLLFVNMNCMQSVGRALPATILSVLRQGVLLIPMLYILNAIAGLHGVIYGQALTDYIAVILSAYLWRKVRKNLE
jgi:multidrug efflux pump